MPRRLAAFIRHADYEQLSDTPSALQPFGLTEKGRQQSLTAADKMREVLKQHHWKMNPIIHCSSSLRAWQTADILIQQLDGVSEHTLRLHSDHQLTERSVGAAANLTIEQIEAIIERDPRFEALPENWKSNSQFKLPFRGAESLHDAGVRVADYLTSVMRQAPLETNDTLTVFVGHGASFRHAACVLGILTLDQVSALSMFHAEPMYFECLDNNWQHIAGEWKLRSPRSAFTD